MLSDFTRSLPANMNWQVSPLRGGGMPAPLALGPEPLSEEGLNSSTRAPEVAGVLLGQGQQKPSPGLAENNYTDSRKHVTCLLQISGNVWRRVNAKELGSPTCAGQGFDLPECGYSC